MVKEVVLWLLWGHVRLPNSGYGINEINTNKDMERCMLKIVLSAQLVHGKK